MSALHAGMLMSTDLFPPIGLSLDSLQQELTELMERQATTPALTTLRKSPSRPD